MDKNATILISLALSAGCLLAMLVVVSVSSCTTREDHLQISDKEHEIEMTAWEDLRRKALTGESGWLNLIGLDWLTPGLNRMGRGEASDVSLPDGDFPSELGVFDWSGNQVSFQAKVNGVKVDGTEVGEPILVFDAKNAIAPLMAYASLRWQVIQRGDLVGVRLRHLESEAVRNFQGVDRFPRQLTWRKEGNFKPFEPHKLIPLANVLGQTIQTPALGTVSFEAEGRSFQLDVFEEGEELFLIFADESSGQSTYGGGRYLYAEKPDARGKVILDFNKAINPPCVFTPFATCPLPPRQNILDLLIEAGEMATYR